MFTMTQLRRQLQFDYQYLISFMDKLQKNISYQFNNIDLLKQALTHRSVSKNNNERLEFLGDSILGCVMSQDCLLYTSPSPRD